MDGPCEQRNACPATVSCHRPQTAPIRNPAFRMWPLGPSCFDGIRTRITLKGHPIGWKTKPCCGYDAGEAVLFRPLRCKPAPRPSFHSAPIWQRAGGGVDIIFRKNMSGSGRCNGYGSQLWREPTVASFPFRQTFEPDRVALTPLLPLVLSPGFEPGLDSSLDCCLYRLGYESMCGYHPCEVAISAQSTIDPATRAGSLHSCLRWTRILRHEA